MMPPDLTQKIFFHGVPDSPVIWSPVLDALGLDSNTVSTPGLPGFQSPQPEGFGGSKDDYANWAASIVRDKFEAKGPVDIVGHDWGALIVHRVSMLVPEMIRSWTIASAVISPNYNGHRTARMWNTPLVGEALMAITSGKTVEKGLIKAGVPEVIASEEAQHWRKRHMRRSILGLYRSANGLRFQNDWCKELDKSPSTGMLIWGEHDPYVPASVAQGFAKSHGYPIKVIPETGHFVLAEKPNAFANTLSNFWNSLGDD